MRALWSGSISFGLVNIPVRLYKASEERELQFDMLHKEDLSPIRYARVCRADGKEIPYEEIVKGYEYQKGDYVVLTDEDFERANVRKTKTIDIVDFTSVDEVDPIYFEKPYYVEPDKGAEKAYALLREALKRSKRVGIAKFVLRNRERLGLIKPEGRVIVLTQMRFAEEIREPKDLNLPTAKIAQKKEVDMALRLIDELTTEFKPEQYKDSYTAELKKVIEEKSKGRMPKVRGKAPQPTRVPDLMAVLKQSLEKQRTKERVRVR